MIPFLAFPPEVRRVIYTTNAIEALNRQLRKAIKTKGHFPNEEAARKLIYLAISNATPPGRRPATGRQPCSRSRSTSETDCPTKPAYTENRTPSRADGGTNARANYHAAHRTCNGRRGATN